MFRRVSINNKATQKDRRPEALLVVTDGDWNATSDSDMHVADQIIDLSDDGLLPGFDNLRNRRVARAAFMDSSERGEPMGFGRMAA